MVLLFVCAMQVMVVLLLLWLLLVVACVVGLGCVLLAFCVGICRVGLSCLHGLLVWGLLGLGLFLRLVVYLWLLICWCRCSVLFGAVWCCIVCKFCVGYVLLPLVVWLLV